MLETPNYTEINVIDNYAPTAKATVTVTDTEGHPVSGAKVEFKIYNYAEFYTVATKYTDAEGKAFLTAGKGDMLVWASRDGKFGYAKLSFGKEDALKLSLDKKVGESYTLPMDIVPPVEGANLPEVTPEQRAENDHRMTQEDSIRNAYVATMMTDEQAKEWVNGLYGNILQPETMKDKLAAFLVASRGNHQTLKDFLSAIRKEKKHISWEEMRGMWLLENISAKDLRDVTLDVLNDHLKNTSDGEKTDTDLVKRALLNPRIANEMLTPYKKILYDAISEAVLKSAPVDAAHDAKALIEWCRKEIKIDNELNSQQIPVSPMGVWKSRVADEKSRDIFFVAAARSIGIPAWIDEVTGKVQYVSDGLSPQDVNFETSQSTQSCTGMLKASYTPIRSLSDPKYYSHFTISKFKNGTFQLLNYDEGDVDMGGGATWSNLLKNGVKLDEGYYMMVTGTRLASGAVLSNTTFFTIEPDKTTTVDLVMRESKDQVQVIGNFNSEATYRPVGGTDLQSILQTCGRGYFVVAVLGVGQEPTNHALRDIAALRSEFEQWGRKMVFLFPSEEQCKKFNTHEFKDLPSTIVYGIDVDNSIQKQIVDEIGKVDDSVSLSKRLIKNSEVKIEDLLSSIEYNDEVLSNVAPYVVKSIKYTDIVSETYITTDNMLQNKLGIVPFVGKANISSITEYKKDDILISNIRPYLKKIWFADKKGGCSKDVLVLRSSNTDKYLPKYIYYMLRRDMFFEYAMEGKKGLKMPRGNKEDILKYRIPVPSIDEQKRIVSQIEVLESLASR